MRVLVLPKTFLKASITQGCATYNTRDMSVLRSEQYVCVCVYLFFSYLIAISHICEEVPGTMKKGHICSQFPTHIWAPQTFP